MTVITYLDNKEAQGFCKQNINIYLLTSSSMKIIESTNIAKLGKFTRYLISPDVRKIRLINQPRRSLLDIVSPLVQTINY